MASRGADKISEAVSQAEGRVWTAAWQIVCRHVDAMLKEIDEASGEPLRRKRERPPTSPAPYALRSRPTRKAKKVVEEEEEEADKTESISEDDSEEVYHPPRGKRVKQTD